MGNVQERRERILRLLMLREKWTMRELAQELGVAERTVIRDIGALSLSKPICVDTGRRGGVYLIERKSLSRPTLTARETAALKHTVAFLVAHAGEFSPGVGDPAPPTPAELQILCEIIAYCGKS